MQPQAQGTYLTASCLPASADEQHLTFAGLPMGFTLTGEASAMRSWYFVNARGTAYDLVAHDAGMGADAAAQAQDEAILATFRPDNAAPWQC